MAVLSTKNRLRGAALGALALTLASCGTGTPGNNGQASASPPSAGAPPAASASQAAPLRVDLDNGACRVMWNGRQVNGAGLLDAAVAELTGVVERAGGPAAITEQMLVLGIVANDDTPWRCVGAAIAQVRRAGYASIALNLEPAREVLDGTPLPINVDLPIVTDAPPPPVAPISNRVRVGDDGSILWNGAPVDATRLRSYLELTRTIRPEPELDLEIAGQTRFDAALTVLGVIQRAGISIGRTSYGAGADLPPPEAGPPGPPDADMRVVEVLPPPGEQFELVGLERFIPDLR